MATMAKRLYVVTENCGESGFKDHLVNAISKAGALSHVVMPKHVVSIATAGEVAKLMGQGVKVEEALGEPQPEPAAPSLLHHDDKKNKIK